MNNLCCNLNHSFMLSEPCELCMHHRHMCPGDWVHSGLIVQMIMELWINGDSLVNRKVMILGEITLFSPDVQTFST